MRKQKRYPIVSLLCGLFCFRHQKYRLALATFLERCKICEVDVKKRYKQSTNGGTQGCMENFPLVKNVKSFFKVRFRGTREFIFIFVKKTYIDRIDLVHVLPFIFF